MNKRLTNFLISVLLLINIFGHLPAQSKARKPNKFQKNKFNKVYDKKLHRIKYYKDQVIVKFKKGTKEVDMKKYMLRNKLTPLYKLGNRKYSCHVNSVDLAGADAPTRSLLMRKGIKTNKVEDQQANEAIVEAVEVDEVRHITENKRRRGGKKSSGKGSSNVRSYTDQQWYLSNDGSNGLKENADINADEAWRYSKGEGVKVAVIDTGFDLKHSDINYDSIGYDVIEQRAGAQAPARSGENHGTAVAGIIAAKLNRTGTTGVAPSSKIIPIRLITDDGLVTISQIIMAHRKAIELGAQIINNSWGTYDPTLPKGTILEISDMEKELYQELANEANDGKGVVIIFASGNAGDSNFNNAPEARLEETIAVGASDSQDMRAGYSSYGPELDVVAPGGANKLIVTTDRRDLIVKRKDKKQRLITGYSKGGYTDSFKGTSAAAPVVAGVAALIMGAKPNITAKDVKSIIQRSAHKAKDYTFNEETGKHPEMGYGRVDALKALELATGG